MQDDIKNTKNVAPDTDAKTAGQILRDARTTGRRKREITTIAKQLCIREEFLQALEDGDYAALPETVYILGFARNYAMELGLNPDEVVEKIKEELGVDSAVVIPDENEEVAEVPETVKKDKIETKITKIKESRVCKFIKQNWKWFVGGLGAVIVIILALLIFLPSDGNHTQAEAVITQSDVVEPAYKIAIHERFGTENRNESEIIFQVIKESWVKVEDVRGKVVFSKVLMPGDVYYAPNGNKNKVTLGNAGGVDVWVRGELIPKLGADHTRKNGVLLDADELLKFAKDQKK